jgi:hypothetical protein
VRAALYIFATLARAAEFLFGKLLEKRFSATTTKKTTIDRFVEWCVSCAIKFYFFFECCGIWKIWCAPIGVKLLECNSIFLMFRRNLKINACNDFIEKILLLPKEILKIGIMV